MKKIVIDGSAFNNMDSFYTEIEKKFTSGLTWEVGRNLNAFNDILWGGFGVHEYGEEICIEWIDSEKSRVDLGYKESEEEYTFFDNIIEIIISHENNHNIKLSLH